jgi:uncharacterized protein YndB with AHSA1/START domain
MPDIRHFVTIDAPPKVVYKAVTEQEGLAGWWTTETIARPEVGTILEFKFGDKYHDKMRLTKLVPDRRVEWECTEGDKEWVGTRFAFDLEDKDGKTVVRFGHDAWREATDFYALCNTTWAFYMQSLKSYCETGKGTPYPEE